MDILDLILIMLALAVALRGVSSGLLRQAGSLGGFAIGLLLGAVLAPVAADYLPAGGLRALVLLTVFFGCGVVLGGIGETLGHLASGVATKYKLSSLDKALGAIFGVAATLFTAWLLASAFAMSAGPELSAEIQGSGVLRLLDQKLPPAPDVLAKLERTLGGGGLPRVFAGLEPSPAPPVTGPDAAAINQAAAAGRAATVKIEGLGCGGIVEGSGFVVGTGLVVTNAHVVAGISRPVVIDARGSHPAQVVEFDPNMDIAVLRTSSLAASPLTLDSGNLPRGSVGAVLGYPGGGSFTVSGAAILSRRTAIGRNIYDSGLVHRDIYELQAVVRPGNSGGPLVAPDGKVIGVVFATSTTNGDIGYALTSAEIIPDVNAGASSGPTSTGPCLSGS